MCSRATMRQEQPHPSAAASVTTTKRSFFPLRTIFVLAMRIRDIADTIERFAPLSLQESYDNSGLIVGRYEQEVHHALLAVDVTEEVLDEAERYGCDIVITHHPIIFHAMKRFNSATYVERCVERAIRSGIALYACHTNLDSASHGMSRHLAEQIGLSGISVLQPLASDPSAGLGAIGELVEEEDAADFLRRIKETFSVGAIRHNGITPGRRIRHVAVCTGAGGSLVAMLSPRRPTSI